MFGLELNLMLGAQLLAFINLIWGLVVAWLLYRLYRKVYGKIFDDEKNNILPESVVLVVLVVFSVAFNSSTSPKIAISPQPNRELIEYQRNNDEIIIETPAPRTENLDGFTPLGE